MALICIERPIEHQLTGYEASEMVTIDMEHFYLDFSLVDFSHCRRGWSLRGFGESWTVVMHI